VETLAGLLSNSRKGSPVTRSPSTGAERMREYRRRRRYGVLSIRIRLATMYIGTLIERRYLKPEHRDDLDEIAIAVGDFLGDSLTARNGRPV
jgi:hypothetical protein